MLTDFWSNPITAASNLHPSPPSQHKVWMSGCWIQAAIYFAQRCQNIPHNTRVCIPACWIAISRLSWQFVVDGIKHFLTRPDTPYHSAVEWCTEGYTTLTPLGKWLRLPLHTTLTSTAHYIPQTLRSSHTFIEFSLKLSDISSTLRTLLYINSLTSPLVWRRKKYQEASHCVIAPITLISPSHHLTSHPLTGWSSQLRSCFSQPVASIWFQNQAILQSYDKAVKSASVSSCISKTGPGGLIQIFHIYHRHIGAIWSSKTIGHPVVSLLMSLPRQQ